MALTVGSNVDVDDILEEHNSDGSHKKAGNVLAGHTPPTNPDLGDVFLDVDSSGTLNICFADDTFTTIVNTGVDVNARVSANDQESAYLDDKLVAAGTTAFVTETDGAYSMSVSGGMPAGLIAFYDPPTGTSVPAGFTRLEEGKGRFIVGLPSGGTMGSGVGGTVGTPLDNTGGGAVLANPTHNHAGGAHTHSTNNHSHTTSGHTHAVPTHNHITGGQSGPLHYSDEGGSGSYGTGGESEGASPAAASSTETASNAAPTTASGGTGNTGATELSTFMPYVQYMMIVSN